LDLTIFYQLAQMRGQGNFLHAHTRVRTNPKPDPALSGYHEKFQPSVSKPPLTIQIEICKAVKGIKKGGGQ